MTLFYLCWRRILKILYKKKRGYNVNFKTIFQQRHIYLSYFSNWLLSFILVSMLFIEFIDTLTGPIEVNNIANCLLQNHFWIELFVFLIRSINYDITERPAYPCSFETIDFLKSLPTWNLLSLLSVSIFISFDIKNFKSSVVKIKQNKE